MFEGKKKRNKESTTMHSELTHQAAKINLLFTHLSHEGRKKNQDDNKKERKLRC